MSAPDFAEVERRRETNEGVHPLGPDDAPAPVPDIGTDRAALTEAQRRFRETTRMWREHDEREVGGVLGPDGNVYSDADSGL